MGPRVSGRERGGGGGERGEEGQVSVPNCRRPRSPPVASSSPPGPTPSAPLGRFLQVTETGLASPSEQLNTPWRLPPLCFLLPRSSSDPLPARSTHRTGMPACPPAKRNAESNLSYSVLGSDPIASVSVRMYEDGRGARSGFSVFGTRPMRRRLGGGVGVGGDRVGCGGRLLLW